MTLKVQKTNKVIWNNIYFIWHILRRLICFEHKNKTLFFFFLHYL